MAREEGLSVKVAREYRIKYGNKTPNLTLARLLYKENPELYTSVDMARTALRRIEGKLGKGTLKDKSLVIQGERPRNPYNLPNAEVSDFSPYTLSSESKRILLLSDCVPVHSEVLTKNGWKRIGEISEGTEILTSDTNKNLKFSPVLAKIANKIDDVYRFKRGGIEFDYTKTHRHLYHSSNGKNLEKTSEELFDKVDLALCATGNKTDGNYYDSDFCKMLGFIIGDGTRDSENWKISVKKSRKVEYLDSIIDDVNFTKNINGEYTVYRVRVGLTAEIDKFLNKKKELNWAAFLDFDLQSLESVLDGIVNSDGTVKKDRPNITISSVMEEHISFVQTLSHLTGRLCTYGATYDNTFSTFPSDKPLHTTTIYSNKSGAYHGKFTGDTHKTEVTCVRVESGFFVMRQNNNIVITGNCHIPYHSIEAITLALDYGKEKQVDTIILNGDTIDFYQLSRFDKDPRKRSVAHELEATRSFLKTLREEFPNAKIIWKNGNHDVRLEKYLLVKAPELLGIVETELKNLIKLPELNIDYIEDKRIIKIQNLNVLHGHEYPSVFSPVNIARGLFMKANANAIQGHNHQSSENTVTTLNGDMITTWSTGCLCDLKAPYLPYNKWNLGFAYIESNENSFEVFNKRIKDSKIF